MMSIRFSILILISAACSAFASSTSHVDNEELVRAMDDEIYRAMTELHIGDLARPYYIEAKLVRGTRYSAHATLGAIEDMDSNEVHTLSVRVRVGTPAFDNTNFFDVSLSFFGSADDEEVYTNRAVPLELDYTTLRRELWLALDACYKQSVEIYAKKQSALKNKTRTDTTWDFGFMGAETLVDTSLASLSISPSTIKHLLTEVSAEFRHARNIQSARLTMEFVPEETLYANSEGRHAHKVEAFTGFEITAVSQADDGMPLSNSYATYAVNPADLPSLDSLLSAAKNVIHNINQLRTASKLDIYNGPVLFTGNAAAEIFAQQFAPYLVAQRTQASEGGFSMGSTGTMAFQNKIGARVLPEFLSVFAQPSTEEFEGHPVAGHFVIDDEGIKAQDITVVDHGYLRNLLSSRVPTKRVKATNGHNRNGSAMLGVVRLSCTDTPKMLSQEDMEERLLELVKGRELEYGIVISAVQNRNLQMTSLFPIMLGDMPMSSGQGTVPLLKVEKLYPDGHRELVRGVEVAGFASATFKDILCVGQRNTVYNYLAPAVVPAYITGGSPYTIATVITPDLLFEDVEVRPIESDLPKLPMVQSPLN